MEKTKKVIINSMIPLVLFLFVFSFVTTVLANNSGWTAMRGSADNTIWGGEANEIQQRVGLGNDDPRRITANIINIVLGFLGILALVLIISGGFKWMTAAGNEDKVAGARKLLMAGVIGLVIILSSYALAAFVVDALFRASTSTANY